MAQVMKRGSMWYSNFTNPNGSGRKVRLVMDSNKLTAQKMADALEAKMLKDCPRQTGSWQAVQMPREAFKQVALEHFSLESKTSTSKMFKRALTNLFAALPVGTLGEITPALLERLRSVWVKNGEREPKVEPWVERQGDGTIAGHGVAGANRQIRALLTIMRWAEIEFDLPVQNWRKLKPWKENGGRVLRYTKEEHDKLKANIPDMIMRTLYMLSYNAGLRRDEARWLWKEDVNFESGEHGHILIRTKTWTDPETGKNTIWSPKSENGRFDATRSIPMNRELNEYLRAWFKVIPGPWLLSATRDQPFLSTTFTHKWAEVVKAADVGGSIHTLRHSYASDLIAGGENVFDVQKFMGHASVKTTEIYLHYAPTVSRAGSSLHRSETPGPMSMMAAA